MLAVASCAAPTCADTYTGSPQNCIHRDVLEHMLAGGAAAGNCEQGSAPRSREGFGESAPVGTSTSVRLSVKSSWAEEPTSSLAVCACVVPPSVMQHAVRLDAIAGWGIIRGPTALSLPVPLTREVSGS